ncbi:hypothetical protein MMC09_000264, partial [Bachmanniomyces sp. S44760]|nr:hypothetical protein [Bachmanniomyces sp. S44760]
MTTYPESGNQAALKVLLCGGLAGVVTWASIFPLDVIKTRMQTQLIPERSAEQHSLLAVSQPSARSSGAQKGAIQIAKQAYQEGGINVFFRGLGVCSVRAFVVNAAQ